MNCDWPISICSPGVIVLYVLHDKMDNFFLSSDFGFLNDIFGRCSRISLKLSQDFFVISSNSRKSLESKHKMRNFTLYPEKSKFRPLSNLRKFKNEQLRSMNFSMLPDCGNYSLTRTLLLEKVIFT